MGTMVTYGPLGEQNYTQCAFISLAMFYAFIIAGQLSGGHGNPSITIALMFTRGAYITWFKAIIYIISQFAGAIAGAAIGKLYFI
jgi:glycerol uptake facilitator-like aquaporin